MDISGVNDDERLAIGQRSRLPGGLRSRKSQEFDAMYTVTSPRDIGRAQSAFAAVAGGWRGKPLDIGCGTEEHVLLAASLGLKATGIDQAEAAVAYARVKAEARGVATRFLVY